jgi:phospholipid/cholesterol/gamma-HCH transport system ATP-binding protein
LTVPRNDPGAAEDDEFRYDRDAVGHSRSGDAIEFVDVHKSFGRNHVLRGLNMALPDNKISMILGPSGTGKSVCIKHIVGLMYPDSGDVIVHGQSIPSLRDSDLFELRRSFGVLFQDGALFGSLNLYDNVAFPLRQHTEKSDEEVAEIVNRRLNEVGLSGAEEKMPNELSGGMRKRAGFARALVLEPEIVLFDEPDSGLDPVRTALLCELIKEIHAEHGGCYVVITHDIMSARRVAEYLHVLWKGRIVESGPAEQLFASENPFVRQFLSGESAGPLGME